MYESILRKPDTVVIESEGTIYKTTGFGGCFETGDIRLEVKETPEGLPIFLTALRTPVSFIRLRWHFRQPMQGQVLGDSFERGYGDMGWSCLIPWKPLYWYFLIHQENVTAGYGVKVRPGAFCFWNADPDGVTLWIDVRNGGEGVRLNGRTLEAACIVWAEYAGLSAFDAARDFCRRMCTDPIFPPAPVYGANNWYYAYGNSTAKQILADAGTLAELCEGAKNRPYMVIDDCWQKGRRRVDGFLETDYIGGPWIPNADFPDMERLAADIRRLGVIPGIWVRFLQDRSPEIPADQLLRDDILDPSCPEVLEHVRRDVERICQWGFRLIKHDFSTVDILGRWGWEMHPLAAKNGWHFRDRTRTSAEIITGFYRAILEAALPYGTLILGCNTVGHLGAGLMHLNRTGDDTSGVLWERTLRLGVNTLAFRMPQHGAFYDVDADCIGVTPQISWEKNRQWGRLLAKSGTPMFVSLQPNALKKEDLAELSGFLKDNSVRRPAAEPLDWMNTILPQKWKLGTEMETFSWYEPEGLSLPWNTGSIWARGLE